MTTMHRLLTIFLLACIAIAPVSAQKVGLVMSGGGAKGLTHIGIIRALEENNVPIDYVAGTSMGAIIGSLYAMGYSPDDMVDLISSDDFKSWYTGNVEPEFQYYFKQDRPTPEFFNLNFSLKDSISTQALRIPLNVLSPIQMNIVFMKLFSSNTAASGGDFDRLFVPFRCVASDVYNKQPLVMRNGDLGDAVRASMTFPFVFKPIEVNGVLAYDGGIYNNFPTDVMKQDFNPDIIIGSVVSSNSEKPKEYDFMSQIENMIMQRTDYSVPDSLRDILMTFNYTNVSLLDFHRIKELEKIGYDRTMQMMDTIKARIGREQSAATVAMHRAVYKEKLPKLRFRDIVITGADAPQQAYIKREISNIENKIFTFEEFQRAYFRLLADDGISEIVPHAEYDGKSQLYRLHLQVKMKENFSLHVGGNVSTSDFNQIYLGLSYQNQNNYSKQFMLDGQLGKIYKNGQFMANIQIPGRIPISYRFVASVSTFDYFKHANVFKDDSPTLNTKNEKFVKAYLALPFMTNRRAEFSFGVARLEDCYFQTSAIDFEKDTYDHSVYKLFGGSVGFYGSTLNARQFATKGHYEKLVAQIYSGREYFRPGNTSSNALMDKSHSWLQITYSKEGYHTLSKLLTLGWLVEGTLSSMNFSQNYTATMMHAAAFTPTAHSKLVYNKAFRANQYLATGIKPLVIFSDNFHLRTEFYGFMPIYPIERGEQNKAYYGKSFRKFEYLGEMSLVCRLPFGSISGYINHYSSPSKSWNLGISLGWNLFNYRFIE